MPKKTFKAAKRARAKVVVQLKNNQPTLLREVQESGAYFQAESQHTSLEKNRHRIETRCTKVFKVRSGLIESRDWKPLVARAIRIQRQVEWFDHRTRSWKQRQETAFYLSSHPLSADEATVIVREHWHCENRNHYVRDVSLGEDGSRIRTQPGVFSRLRSFALNLLRLNQVGNIKARLFENALDFQRLIQMKGIMN